MQAKWMLLVFFHEYECRLLAVVVVVNEVNEVVVAAVEHSLLYGFVAVLEVEMDDKSFDVVVRVLVVVIGV